jgi:hypothetical protein
MCGQAECFAAERNLVRKCRPLVFLLAALVPRAGAELASAGLEPGFRRLYDLDFAGGQKELEAWEKVNPGNPMGPVSEAAGILFSGFNRLGVLEAQFSEDDSVFAARTTYKPSLSSSNALSTN